MIVDVAGLSLSQNFHFAEVVTPFPGVMSFSMTVTGSGDARAVWCGASRVSDVVATRKEHDSAISTPFEERGTGKILRFSRRLRQLIFWIREDV
ncbi:hypothetical protein [Streptosporangium sp. NPDC020145]|uniref:hypothetical protein n=1 Tax=Streptosporangium sp. NPDC020145 TaxID=3154694 RepID=UPI00342292EB